MVLVATPLRTELGGDHRTDDNLDRILVITGNGYNRRTLLYPCAAHSLANFDVWVVRLHVNRGSAQGDDRTHIQCGLYREGRMGGWVGGWVSGWVVG